MESLGWMEFTLGAGFHGLSRATLDCKSLYTAFFAKKRPIEVFIGYTFKIYKIALNA
jgi:hypothetical protein